jgi:hypothetical protein
MAEPPPVLRPSRNRAYVIVSCIVSLFVAVALSIGYSAQAVHSTEAANAKAIAVAQQANRHSLQQICGIIVILDDAYHNPATPPTSSLGKKLADAMHTYREFLGCDHL